jgi:hypothetical protein
MLLNGIAGVYSENETKTFSTKLSVNEHRGRMFNNTASYVGGLGFKFWPEDRLSWLRFVMGFLSSSRR